MYHVIGDGLPGWADDGRRQIRPHNERLDRVKNTVDSLNQLFFAGG
jgi:hypothetical protein